jgi:hypothetical protein
MRPHRLGRGHVGTSPLVRVRAYDDGANWRIRRTGGDNEVG